MLQKPLLDLYQDLHQIVIYDNALVVDPAVLAGAVGRLGREDNRPLLVLCPPAVNPALFLDTTRQVAGIIKKYFPYQESVFDHIIRSLQEEPERLTETISRIFIPGTDLTTCFKQELPPEALGLLFSHTVQIFMKQYVKKVTPALDLDHWNKGVCPICGGKPNLSLLEKDNNGKYLHCGYCDIQWRAKRLGCPFCPSPDSRYLFIEDTEKYRVYVCEKCGGYIKTIVLEKSGDGELNLLLEDINSIEMDLFALKEGYHK